MRHTLFAIAVWAVMASATGAWAQQGASPSLTPQQQAARDATRERLRSALAVSGAKVNIAFHQSEKNPYNFVGSLTQGLKNAQSLEVVVSVTKNETIGVRIYPHYNGGYINIDRAKNGPNLMRALLYFSDQNFLFWGADDAGDVFSAYTFTLESGFPDAAIDIVVRSIPNTDKFVGQLKPHIDGSEAP